MNMDTPRTDATEPQLHSNVGGWVRADFARELERELKASQADVEFWKAKAYEAEEMEGKHEADVERLGSQLALAVEIAETACKYLDTGGWNEDELYSGKDGWVTETEINEVCASLAALKEEIK